MKKLIPLLFILVSCSIPTNEPITPDVLVFNNAVEVSYYTSTAYGFTALVVTNEIDSIVYSIEYSIDGVLFSGVIFLLPGEDHCLYVFYNDAEIVIDSVEIFTP